MWTRIPTCSIYQRYIHLNPVVAGLADAPEAWEFSSYRNMPDCGQDLCRTRRSCLSQFASQAAGLLNPRMAYCQFVRDGMGIRDEKIVICCLRKNEQAAA